MKDDCNTCHGEGWLDAHLIKGLNSMKNKIRKAYLLKFECDKNCQHKTYCLHHKDFIGLTDKSIYIQDCLRVETTFLFETYVICDKYLKKDLVECKDYKHTLDECNNCYKDNKTTEMDCFVLDK